MEDNYFRMDYLYCEFRSFYIHLKFCTQEKEWAFIFFSNTLWRSEWLESSVLLTITVFHSVCLLAWSEGGGHLKFFVLYNVFLTKSYLVSSFSMLIVILVIPVVVTIIMWTQDQISFLLSMLVLHLSPFDSDFKIALFIYFSFYLQ